ncbi:tRNA methyltransferase 10 homolog C [Erpetoichthys calabaricus]|uniref:tRNA methyltransferase 10 homolog C n=1 Tax=Erpetoichthys calabaricus TaxID=27687 RepID=A0A8C4XAT1_ERPCA|nr:tRNA methyltransferase 10 homolog C [Erpetoichthys calabaricus]XP_028655775.1 tRNA methyltransferase 10 homolog C [Erpetoichthys calabaricus]
MRFLKSQIFNILRRQCFRQEILISSRQGTGTIVQTPQLLLLPPLRHRCLSTAQWIRRESSQSCKVNTEKVDLDVWKSLMKNEECKSTSPVPTADAEEDAPLDATQELVQMWRESGRLVPENMTKEELQIFAELSTKSAKKKYLKYLAIKENNKKARKEKKKIKQEQVKLEVIEKEPMEHPKNTFLLQFWQRSMDSLYNWRAAQALLFGQPLVFDMSYEHYMSRQELENTVFQLQECEGWNRKSNDPFHLYFCNLKLEGTYHKELKKRYREAWDRLLITATEKTHVELFSRDKLVYLTADSPNVLRTFDHDKIYIVGSMVDKSIQRGLSLANAKRLKLATARLPLDEHLHWESGAKNLTLDQVMRILLTIKDSNNWEDALNFVPKRKHDGFIKSKTQHEKEPIFKSQPIGRNQKPTAIQKPTFIKKRLEQTTVNPKERMKWWEE